VIDAGALETPAGRARLRLDLDRERGRRSLARFMRLAWSQIEPNALVWNWHLDAMAEHLEAVSRDQIQRLLINVPPGMSKSLSVATLWPAWDWIEHTTRRFIFATYAQDLSEKNAKLHRDLVMSKWYADRWGHVQIAKESTKRVREFHNTQKGWRFSTSVGGQVTGRHGDVLVFDDLVKAQDSEGRAVVDPIAIEKANDFWFKTMATRRADPRTTKYVGIMQRLHHEDAAAQCIEKGGYVRLVLPMEYDPPRKCVVYMGENGKLFSPPPEGSEGSEDWSPPEDSSVAFEDPREEPGELLNPARFPREVVEADRTTLGSVTFESQMQQNPTPRDGNIFKAQWFPTWSKLPSGLRMIITVDCAFKDTKKSDYVAIQCWGVKNPNYYLIDQFHGRFNVKKTMEKIAEMKDRWPRSVGVYVEDKANGSAVITMLEDTIPGLNAWNPGTASKISRAEAVAPIAESGNVWLPDPEGRSWVQPLVTEVTRFPLVKHDDRTDALTMALLILHKPRHRRYRDAVKRMVGGA